MVKKILASVLLLSGIVTVFWSTTLKADKGQNGIRIFEKGEAPPPLPAGLSADIPVISKFGFKIVKLKDKYYLQAATEADYRASEAGRLGIDPKAVKIRLCLQTGPQSCPNEACGGYPGGWCRLAYDPQGPYYYCTCT